MWTYYTYTLGFEKSASKVLTNSANLLTGKMAKAAAQEANEECKSRSYYIISNYKKLTLVSTGSSDLNHCSPKLLVLACDTWPL